MSAAPEVVPGVVMRGLRAGMATWMTPAELATLAPLALPDEAPVPASAEIARIQALLPIGMLALAGLMRLADLAPLADALLECADLYGRGRVADHTLRSDVTHAYARLWHALATATGARAERVASALRAGRTLCGATRAWALDATPGVAAAGIGMVLGEGVGAKTRAAAVRRATETWDALAATVTP